MADSNLLVLAKEFSKLRNDVKEVLKMPVGPEGKQGERGLPGKDGKDGLNGRDGVGIQGPAGAPGRDGRDGKDGIDGVDGKDGVSVTNAYVDFDGSLVIELSDGNQIDAGFVSVEARDSVIQQLKNGALSLNELLPSQTGNNGKALLTDGTDTYWGTVSGGGGAVDSVNGQTGTVVLDYTDVGAASAAQGALADTAVQPNSSPTLNNVYVSGDLEVNGSITTVTTQTLQVEDPLIYVASGAASINTLDQGIVGHFSSGTYQHTGLVRDHSDGKWKLFKGVTDEPTTTINWSQAVYDTLKLGTLEATTININGTSFTNTDASNWNTAYGWGNHASAGYLTTSSAASTYQPLDGDLTAIAGLSGTTGLLKKTAANTWTLDTTAYGTGTVTSVSAITLGTTGTDLSSTVATGTSTPVITLNVPTASATNRGALSSTDWSTFNGKQAALVSGTNIKTVNSTSLLGSGDISVQPTLVSGTNIKTINGTSLLGSGDIAVGGSGSFTGGTLTSNLTLAAGSTSLVPLDFQSGTLLTTPAAGNLEYDGTAFFATPFGSSRGVLPAEQFVMLGSTNTLTSQTAAQPIFDGGGTGLTGGAVTLAVGTYQFECQFSLTAMSTTSGSFGFALVPGTAVVGSQLWYAYANRGAANATGGTTGTSYNTTAVTTLATNATTGVGFAYIRGILRVTTAGTVIPSVSLTQAAAAVVGANAWFKVSPISSAGTGAITVGNWS